jgi:ATP-dependent Clp protease ATP-binding subunit ClpC
MFVGPTGVGKTALCKVLSKEVALGDVPLIKVDMSEYSEKHSSSKMIGTAPGYVGYGEGGQLTEKVKNNPYSIILFDEIEKAHPDVFNVFLQLLDEGRMTDGEGTTVDFTNCIVVMTSNAGYGAEKLSSGTIGFGTVNDVENKDKEKIALEALRETFKPEFLNRLDNIVVFDALGKEQCENVTKIMLNKLSDRLYNNSGIKVKFNKSVVKHITDVGYSEKYGARNIKRAIQNEIEDALADSIISGKYKSGDSVSMKYSKNNVELTKLA